MSWRTDNIAHYCSLLADEYPKESRCLSAMRRSGRDIQFNGHISQRRLIILVVRVVLPLIQWLNGFFPDTYDVKRLV